MTYYSLLKHFATKLTINDSYATFCAVSNDTKTVLMTLELAELQQKSSAAADWLLKWNWLRVAARKIGGLAGNRRRRTGLSKGGPIVKTGFEIHYLPYNSGSIGPIFTKFSAIVYYGSLQY